MSTSYFNMDSSNDLNAQLLRDKVSAVLNRVTKWRAIFAGWQLGTRPKNDGECRAVKNHREITMLTRIELNAVSVLLIKKGLITQKELLEETALEAEHYERVLQEQFPGLRATDDGMSMQLPAAAETMKKYNFPP